MCSLLVSVQERDCVTGTDWVVRMCVGPKPVVLLLPLDCVQCWIFLARSKDDMRGFMWSQRQCSHACTHHPAHPWTPEDCFKFWLNLHYALVFDWLKLFALIFCITKSKYYSDKVSVHTEYALLRLPNVLGANLELSQKPSFLPNAAENQMRQDVGWVTGTVEAAWRHAPRLRAPSEHLIEFSRDKISCNFSNIFLPLGAQQGFNLCLLGDVRDERGATGYRT